MAYESVLVGLFVILECDSDHEPGALGCPGPEYHERNQVYTGFSRDGSQLHIVTCRPFLNVAPPSPCVVYRVSPPALSSVLFEICFASRHPPVLGAAHVSNRNENINLI